MTKSLSINTFSEFWIILTLPQYLCEGNVDMYRDPDFDSTLFLFIIMCTLLTILRGARY